MVTQGARLTKIYVGIISRQVVNRQLCMMEIRKAFMGGCVSSSMWIVYNEDIMLLPADLVGYVAMGELFKGFVGIYTLFMYNVFSSRISLRVFPSQILSSNYTGSIYVLQYSHLLHVN